MKHYEYRRLSILESILFNAVGTDLSKRHITVTFVPEMHRVALRYINDFGDPPYDIYTYNHKYRRMAIKKLKSHIKKLGLKYNKILFLTEFNSYNREAEERIDNIRYKLFRTCKIR